MELDLSALMGGDANSRCGVSLNDEFSVQMPSGENVFGHPFGDQTTFNSPGGSVTVSYIFNPRKRWTSKAILASSTTDYMNEIRERMCKMLLQKEDIAPRQASNKEKQWRSILRNLPNETLTKHIFSDKDKLDDFISILRQTSEAETKEDKLLTEALKKQEFQFSFEIALDAFPAVDQNKHGREKATRPSQSGTITFYFEGSRKIIEEKEKEKEKDLDKIMTDNIDPAKTQIKQSKSCPSSPASDMRTLKKKPETTKERKEKETLKKLKTKFGLNKPEWENARMEVEKKIPLTASLFFDSVSSWFNCSIQTRSRTLQDQKDRSHLYQ